MALAVVILAAFLRLVAIDRIPPGLWYDEAIYALDALTIGRGNWPIFFTTENHMREPLYIYSLAGFFALFGHSVATARIATALWGTATVALFFPVTRRLLGSYRWALVALLAFAVFRWHIHFSRTIFRASLPPFFILLVLLFLLRWRERRRLSDAVLAGCALGAGMYTYLSFRLVPLLVIALLGWLAVKREITWRRDAKHAGAFCAAAIVVFLPLGVDYLLHPEHFRGRTDEISMFRKKVKVTDAAGTRTVEVAKTITEAARDIAGNALAVAKMWTIRGDHVGKHNLPYAPVLDWANGIVFYAGLLWCLLNARKELAPFVMLVWLALMCMTSVFSFGAPNILRMQGATPAVILIYVLGLRWIWGLAPATISRMTKAAVVAAMLLLFAALQLHTYFVKFPRHPAVIAEFQKETFYEPAVLALQATRQASKVYVPAELAAHPSFAFVTARQPKIAACQPAQAVPTTETLPLAVLVTPRSQQLANEAGVDQLSSLQRTKTVRQISQSYLTVPGDPPRSIPWARMFLVTEPR